ncbi:MAG: 2-C-methyl-D-erythritol 4-phosphate cytidylyltransferase [Gammaproteobacteria bacterium]|nr:2-C-methyl-D-erythritol 4-phosphate cytidylyltransferase [Gammaproteobacteria bacterium]
MSARVRRWAVVVAAGRGQRFGGPVPKQYTRLLGRPVLSWSLAALLAEPAIDGVVVALAAGDRRWRSIPEAKDARVGTCIGGDRRETSVARALAALEGRARDSDWVIVHDAARPCLAAEDLRRLIAATRSDPVGGLLAAPVADTLKADDGHGRSARTASREGLWRALTPQMFRYGLLKRALALCFDRERPVTDEAAAIEALGLRPLLVRGRADNIKLTNVEDRVVAEAILRSRRSG